MLAVFLFFSCQTTNIISKGIHPVETKVFSTESQILPKRIIFDTKYYQENNAVFFIASNYTQDYSKLIEYNLKSDKIDKVIFDEESTIICDYDSNQSMIVFTAVNSNSEEAIYYYNITSKVLEKYNGVLPKSENGYYPNHVSVGVNWLCWIEHDFEERISKIKALNLNDKTTKIICEKPFIEDRIRVPYIFIDMQDDYLAYDERNSDGSVLLYILDLNGVEPTIKLEAMKDVVLHYNGSYNPENNYLALYALTNKNDLIYRIDITNNKATKLAGFYEHAVLYDDIIETNNNQILYTIQKNVSGEIKDHYYAEIYNLDNYTMSSEMGCLHIVKNEMYTGLLRFDEIEDIQKIHFELYQN
ncbi:hypothetical protein [Sediminispirochaeta bajacaliforniensis]|uniref:hypothetical protein n=1 Tax=Sediminispirochaeta bajacaliforniensis TaxID=148 RepID=UPI00037491AE|nr:hypothetical protein [Sediminispirochaeta bajacaliforniensis]